MNSSQQSRNHPPVDPLQSVIFFGSGPVAAKSLLYLAEHTQIETVVTKPRPPHHRGDVPVIRAAKELGLPIHTAADKQSLDALIQQQQFQSHIGVLIDFGIIVSQTVIDYFPLGIVNSHFSLLPEWRGADPITFAILSGQPQTGVSLMLLVPKMDEGPIIAQATFNIDSTMDSAQLTTGLIELSDAMLKTSLPLYRSGSLVPYEQSANGPDGLNLVASYSRKLTKDDARLDFQKPAVLLEREVRAFHEWPKSKTTLAGKEVIVTAAEVRNETGSRPIGSVYQTGDHKIAITTPDNTLVVTRLKPAGKPEMTAEAFLAGYGTKL